MSRSISRMFRFRAFEDIKFIGLSDVEIKLPRKLYT